MNKPGGRIVAVILAAVVSVAVTTGCGLPDQVLVLDPPYGVILASGSIDPNDRFFEFTTDHGNDGQGTRVFYRIYASVSALTRDRDDIRSAGANTVNTQSGYNRMAALGYRELDSSAHSNYLVVQSGYRVRIRLFDEGFSASTVYPAGITSNGASLGIPYRRSPSNKGFSFFYTGDAGRDANPLPVSGDADTNFTGYTDGSEWYVNAYAVTVGQDFALSLSYSELAELGYITISP